MRFLYNREQVAGNAANCFLLWNGLGGYCSVAADFSAPRADQGILVAAVKAPNERINLVHRVDEVLTVGDRLYALSDAHLDSYWVDGLPVWEYSAGGVRVQRRCAMAYGENTAAVLYRVENDTCHSCTLSVTPLFKFAPKETALSAPLQLEQAGNRISCGGYHVYIRTDGILEAAPHSWQWLAYPEDAKDGRPGQGMAGSCCRILVQVQPGQTLEWEAVFSMEEATVSGKAIWQQETERLRALADGCGLEDPVARLLAVSADAYIARRDSTGGKTILAGYPLFSDWGRDTMIALTGCTLTTGRTEDAKSILRTFLAYEKDGLVPNLFPEGGHAPMYNTVDAALLLIDCVWQYYQRTGDEAFVREAYPVMERIIEAYRTGTRHAIGMDTDGLIYAGAGLDQVTWMDVCIQGILPTPRHGKPVEINAYWYNALKIMEKLSYLAEQDGSGYGALAQQVKESFNEKFYIEEKGYLRDVLSGTDADTQIRCNQIWALSMPFTMLPPERERAVLDTVEKHLLTPCGLRTLSPEDEQYRGFYGGDQLIRDMAYHQGTTWVFPMGAYYRACLRIRKDIAAVQEQLAHVQAMLEQGCAGQLPEIYDGNDPYEGKGCFAQAWSVGELLRVYEELERG